MCDTSSSCLRDHTHSLCNKYICSGLATPFPFPICSSIHTHVYKQQQRPNELCENQGKRNNFIFVLFACHPFVHWDCELLDRDTPKRRHELLLLFYIVKYQMKITRAHAKYTKRVLMEEVSRFGYSVLIFIFVCVCVCDNMPFLCYLHCTLTTRQHFRCLAIMTWYVRRTRIIFIHTLSYARIDWRCSFGEMKSHYITHLYHHRRWTLCVRVGFGIHFEDMPSSRAHEHDDDDETENRKTLTFCQRFQDISCHC